MELDWVEAVGYAGTGLTILAYAVRDLVPLRVAGILSSLAFLAYGMLTQSYPLVLMEALLLPINIYRLLELRTDGRRHVGNVGERYFHASGMGIRSVVLPKIEAADRAIIAETDVRSMQSLGSNRMDTLLKLAASCRSEDSVSPGDRGGALAGRRSGLGENRPRIGVADTQDFRGKNSPASFDGQTASSDEHPVVDSSAAG